MRKITTEAHVKQLVKEWYEQRGAWSYSPIQNGMGVHGIPDRVGCVPIVVTQAMVGKRIGLFVAIEAKAPGRRGEAREGCSVHQANHLRDINAAAGVGEKVDGKEELSAVDGQIEWIQGK